MSLYRSKAGFGVFVFFVFAAELVLVGVENLLPDKFGDSTLSDSFAESGSFLTVLGNAEFIDSPVESRSSIFTEEPQLEAIDGALFRGERLVAGFTLDCPSAFFFLVYNVFTFLSMFF